MQLCDPTQIRGLREIDLYNFYKAAATFYESSVWVGLSATQHREFFLSKPVTKDSAYQEMQFDPTVPTEEDTIPRSTSIGTPIYVCGLQSATHKQYNGTRAEIIGPLQNNGRWPIRACSDGLRFNVKPTNIRIDTSMKKWGLVKICGADGGSGGYLYIHQAWGDLFNNRDANNPNPNTNEFLSPVLICEFYDPAELTGQLNPAILRQHKKIRAPLAENVPAFRCKDGDLRKVFFPVISGMPEDGKFRAQDFKLLEAAFLSSVTFLRDHLYQRRKNATFEPTTIPLTLRDNLTCICSFPHAELNIIHRKWTSFPSSCQHYASRPYNVKTIHQAIAFHSSIIGDLDVALGKKNMDRSLSAHLYGLANCLWESEVLENVKTAARIAKILFDHTPLVYCHSEVCNFLLDLLLELGDWEDAVLYLDKMPEENKQTEVFLFSSALVWFRSRGKDSSSAKKALTSAMAFNKWCVPMMLGIEHTNSAGTQSGVMSFSVERNSDGSINTDGYKKPMATQYVRNYKKHWVLDEDSLSFLRDMYGGKSKKKKKKKKNKKKQSETTASTSGVNIQKMLCANCGKFQVANQKPKKCSACLKVSYCNAIW